MGSEPQGFATCRSYGQSTEWFSEFGCHTQVVGAEHTLYKTALSFLWMSWSTILLSYCLLAIANHLLSYVLFIQCSNLYIAAIYACASRPVDQRDRESEPTLTLQHLHCRRNLSRCGVTSTITRHHIAEHRRQERPRGALHARRNRATPHHRWVERSTPVADPRPVMFPTYCVIRTSCGLQAQGRDSWVVMQGYIARHSEGKGKESE